ncbi:MAG TPA: double-strand break repair helicase AddA [Hyphomonas sp.]|nr:double-strand break repair helicase AddA [Hyphomonas sp.]
MSNAAHDLAYKAATLAQATAAEPTQSAYAMANAGSGKTKVLIDRVARLLLRRPDGRPGANPDSILCITYTRAAASEMLSRLFRTLGDWAVMEDEKLSRELATLEGGKPGDYTADRLKAARALFAKALETPGGLRIETIHAFCARILRRFPLEAGVVPGFVELEEEDAREIWTEAKRRAILAAARECPDALAMIAREAGNEGASTALDALRAAGAAARAFCAAWDNDAAAIEAALQRSINPPTEGPDELIANAMGRDLPSARIRQAIGALYTGKPTDAKLADNLLAVLEARSSAEALETYASVFFTTDGELRKKNAYTKGASAAGPGLDDLFSMEVPQGSEVQRIQRVLGDLKRAQAFARTAALFRVGAPALQAYSSEKDRRAALDFDDLIERTRDLLSTDGMSSWVLYKLDGGLSHVLLDEAQDTSPNQWELIRALTHEFTSGAGRERLQDPRTLFIVGDEKQSIYSFQGADPAKFLEETQALTSRDATVAHADMKMSFRSSPEILTYVDTVWNAAPPIDVPPGSDRPSTAEITEHTAKRWNEPGWVELWPVAAKDPEPEADAWDRPVDALRVTSPKVKVAQAVADRVKDMISGGAAVWDKDGKRRPAAAGDILILVRERRGGLFEALINAMKARGIPVAGADRLRLADYIGVQDCLNLMRFALLPSRDLVLAEILRGPFAGLVDDDRYLFELASGRAPDESLWSRIQASDDPEVARVSLFLSMLAQRAHLPPFEFLSSVLDQPRVDGATGWEMINARLGAPARDPVEALLAQALAHDAAGPSSMQAFVAGLEATPVEIKRDLAEAGGEVRVMTVHGAKGLQSPIVILPDTTAKPKLDTVDVLKIGDAMIWAPRQDTDTPASEVARAIAQAKAHEEHRRLLYVALTRAQDHLLIAGHWYGGTKVGAAGYDANSWYALCRNAMGVLGAEADDAERLRFGAPVVAEVTEAGSAGERPKLPEWARKVVAADDDARKLMAPTSLLGPKTKVVAPFDPKREARLRRGRLIHSLLQHLPELPESARRAAGKAMLDREPHLTKAQRDEMLRAAEGILSEPGLKELFGRGGRAEAAVIGTSDELPKGTVINGRVDRLVVTPDRVLVIDFKTDQPAPDAVEDVAENYILQMAAYRAVLATAYRGREVTAILCWTDGPKMMRLPDAMLAESLAKARQGV